MDRYVIFKDIGATIIKGDYTPKQGEVFIKNPNTFPLCSIKYWKYDNGNIAEMSDTEKSNIDIKIKSNLNRDLSSKSIPVTISNKNTKLKYKQVIEMIIISSLTYLVFRFLNNLL
jgi:hypothetical protein